MQFIEQLLSDIQTNSDFLNFFGILLTALVSIYIFKKESSSAFTRERHDKLIFPLFNLLEPVLYQNASPDILSSALKIIEDNKNIADGKLLELFYFYSHHPSQENFQQLCTYADRMYDKSCWKLGLKLRSVAYRINRKQYNNKITLILCIIFYAFISFCIGMLIFCFAFCGIVLLLSVMYETSNTFSPFITFLMLILFCLATMKFLDKHS